MRTIFILLLFVIGIGCRDKCDMEPGYAEWTWLELNFFNAATGEPLIKDSNSLYTKADIKVFDEQQKALEFKLDIAHSENHGDYYKIIVLNGISQTTPFNKEICDKLFIDFKNDRDTLGYCYSVKSFPCNATQVENLKATFNNSAIESLRPDGLYEYNISK